MIQGNRSRRSSVDSIPAPVGGMNDRDSIAAMPKKDARKLENIFPGTSDVETRGGCVEHAAGLPNTGESLLGYNGIETSALFAASGGNIYNISTGGVVGAPIITGQTNSRWDHVNFGGAAGNFLVAVNGQNLPKIFNGTSWAESGTGFATAITGVNAATFSQVSVWKNRLFFVQENTLKCWYLGTQAIGGAATAFDFAGVARLGGKLIATASVSSSAGSTLEDYFVAITSEGECLVYQGTDPASITTFALVGNYRIGRPIANGSYNSGGRFLAKLSSQVIALTADGFVNLQDAINSDVVAQRLTINDKIVNAINNDVQKYKANFGWQIMLMPIKNRLYINVPIAQGLQSHQWVMNTISGAWCKYTGWNATCFLYWKDELYSIIGTKVYKMDVDFQNDFVSASSTGATIDSSLDTAYIYTGSRGQLKNYKMVRAIFMASGDVQPGVGLGIDFKQGQYLSTANISFANNAARWNVGIWNVTITGAGEKISQFWRSITGIGYCCSLQLNIKTNLNKARLLSWDIISERGGLL